MNKMLYRLVISQFKLFFREPGVVFWSFGFPVLMAWILGIAFANKGEIERNIAVVAENPVPGNSCWTGNSEVSFSAAAAPFPVIA